jgi:hypothetical protein
LIVQAGSSNAIVAQDIGDAPGHDKDEVCSAASVAKLANQLPR